MSDVTSNIIIGVVSGVFTCIFWLIVVKVFENIAIPWYKKLIYSGIDISGEWFFYGKEFAQTAKIEIKQDADRIYGIATYIDTGDEIDTDLEAIRVFNIEGFVKERFVNMVLVHNNKARVGMVTYLLEVVGDGRKMVGAGSYYCVITFAVEPIKIVISRYEMKDKELKEIFSDDDNQE